MNILIERFDLFRDSFYVTLEMCVLAAIGSLVIGTIVAVMRISPVPPLRGLGTAYVNTIRNTPLTVVAYFAAFVLPVLGARGDFLNISLIDTLFPGPKALSIDAPFFRFFLMALSVYTAAFVCEALRAGINAVSPGQAEAARSIGLTFGQNLRLVVLPQAWRYAIVPLGSVIIAMIKNSAIGAVLGVGLLLSTVADTLTSQEGLAVIPVFTGISIGYLVMTVPLGMFLDRVEKRRAAAAR